MTGKAPPPIAPEGMAFRDQVLVNEARTEMKGSLVAWIALAVVTAFAAFEFAGKAEPLGYFLWLGTITAFLASWLISWVRFVRRPPGDDAILTRLIPRAKAGMTLCNIATAGSVWVFLPAAGPELRALLLVLYAWYLIVQFAAATEATQVLRSAVVLVLGSLVLWLLVARPPYFLPLSLFLLLFGATLIAIRRFVRQAVTTAKAAEAAAAAAGVQVSIAGRRISLRADPLLLARALENLVANAIRHSSGRRILMGARARVGEVTIWVVDDGRGLAAGDEARIFSPFEQGAHVGEAGGFGLGLASTWGLVALMDGTCGVQAGLTRGAAFYIRLRGDGADREDDVRCAA